MKALGIITEYNPFHNGHLYHLRKSLKTTDADYTICVMSGNFVQRGNPAIIDKWNRVKMALEAGIDLVLELPIAYALRSAEYFAYGGVQLLNQTGIVDKMVFGSELGEIEPLIEISEILADEPTELSNLIQEELDKGVSFPKARAEALSIYIPNLDTTLSTAKVKKTINNPNNILGIEYIKALIQTNSQIKPLTIKRKGADYHQTKIKGKITSATAIRNTILKDQSLQDIKELLPSYSFDILKENIRLNKGPIDLENFELPILTILRRTSPSTLKEIEDVTGGLENRIKDAANQATSLLELIDLIKTKRFTQTRIQRILLHLLLGLNKSTLKGFDKAGGPQYLRILGFSKKGQKILKTMKETSKLPLINRVANHYKSAYPADSLKAKMLAMEVKATNIYSLAYNNPKYRQGGQDYTQPLILKN
ncbi:nucleotidyltransferase [Selenihalanaerobacter shriftii]|uniref:tRNA(Met) cytidine acetate ligase n=1 Tax=Selenihalanaerobacter shriftii TaxID=142842 RepID=A0A1T4PJX6_9FIRM|nr:nucleotidyltransferase [Selenihalanaerobacter shriftii]SJZ91198.1 Predicted nucleotidyltransferase [Selenihalanaerobacter shriftii]